MENNKSSVGTRMPDGTVYAGVSPKTGKPLYALPADAPLAMKWKRAIDYAANFEGHGHPKGSFRLPSTDELKVLFQNRAAIGGFARFSGFPYGWYWSSAQLPFHIAAGANFSDEGRGFWFGKSNAIAVRLVRSGP